MSDQWFYGQDANKHGPYSSAQLRELAVAGQIRPTDTVWKGGIESGVLAAKVKNLFPAGQSTAAGVAARSAAGKARAPVPDAHAPVADAPGSLAEAAATPPTAPAIAPEAPSPSELQPAPATIADKRTYKPASAAIQERKGRVISAKGATVLGQDGINVQLIKECTVCGFKDRNKTRLPIKQGTTRIGFFCPKCRKLRQVEVQGIL